MIQYYVVCTSIKVIVLKGLWLQSYCNWTWFVGLNWNEVATMESKTDWSWYPFFFYWTRWHFWLKNLSYHYNSHWDCRSIKRSKIWWKFWICMIHAVMIFNQIWTKLKITVKNSDFFFANFCSFFNYLCSKSGWINHWN